MMPTLLIIGAGSRVGQATADAFAAAGYTIAVASRSGKIGSKYKHFTFDASKPETVRDLFSEVRRTTGIPSVVIYNGMVPSVSFRIGTRGESLLTCEQPIHLISHVQRHHWKVPSTSFRPT